MDGDALSLAHAAERIEAAGLGSRVQLVHSPLEEMHLDEPAALVINNTSMHESRNIDRVTPTSPRSWSQVGGS